MRAVHNVIDGKPVPAEGGRTTDLIAPATGEVFGTAPLSSESDVDAAYRSASRAFQDWKLTTPAERQRLLLRLADDGVITGIKDSSGDDAGLRRLLRMRGGRRPVVLTGSELTVDNALANGADGVVPGLGNVDPHGYLALARHVRDGDLKAAAAEQDRLADLFGMVEAGDPARIGPSSAGLGSFKAALHLRGIIDCPATMPPQLPLSEQEVVIIRTLLDRAGLL